MEKRMQLAIPSNAPGGLAATRSDHFGHCELFTLVAIENGKVAGVETVRNVAHEAGGCLAPVRLLRGEGIDAIVVGGMGARPLNGFAEAGVTVYFAGREAFVTVQAAVDGFLAGQLPVMQPSQVCQGHGNCGGHGHG